MGAHPLLLELAKETAERIAAIELQYDQYVSNTDLRRPIEHYQEFLVQALSSHDTAQVEDISTQMRRLTQHQEWLTGGAHVFLRVRDFEQALELKRGLLRTPATLEIPPLLMLENIHDFLLFYTRDMETETKSRYVMRIDNRAGKVAFADYPATEFEKDILNALHEYRDNPASAAKLKFFWVQITHPLALLEAYGKGNFRIEHYITESTWRQMASDAMSLSDMYRNYSVLFAALLKPAADKSFLALTEQLNAQVIEASRIKSAAQKTETGNTKEGLENADSDIITAEMDAIIKDADNKLRTIDKAHLHFLADALKAYQASLDLIKKLNARGINLAGTFTAKAGADTTKGRRR